MFDIDTDKYFKKISENAFQFTDQLAKYFFTNESHDKHTVSKKVYESIEYVDDNNYDIYINSKGKVSFIKMFIIKYIPLITIFIFIYLFYLQVRAMMGKGQPPKWGLVYLPLIVISLYNMFNMFSVIKISF
jgi:ATP-dependent Zn protease